MRRFGLAAALIALAAGPALAEAPPATPPSPAMNEDDVVALWLRNSREVESLRAQIGAARFDVVTATVFPNPQLQLATSTVIAGKDHPPDGLYNWGPQITQALPILGQISARRRAALAAVDVAELNVLATLWDHAADLKDAMLARAFAQARLDGAARNLAELESIRAIVETRAAAGANPRYDVLRVGTTEATLRAAVVSATIDRDQAEARLVALIAAPGVTRVPVTLPGLAPFHGPADEQGLVALALRRRPDIELARRQVVAADLNAARFHRENVPTPSVYLGTYHTYDAPSTSVQAGVSFALPIFDRNQGPLGRARSEAAGGRALADALAVRIEAEVRGTWRARTTAATALEAFRKGGLANTQELLERATVSYRAGSFQILDLLDAYRSVWEARAQELDLQRSLSQAEADLERAAALVTPRLTGAS